MAGKKVNFTEAEVRGLKCSATRTFISDSGQNGLRIKLTPAGNKIFEAHAWSREHKKMISKTLGKYPVITVQHARKLTIAFVHDLADGKDLEQQRQEKKLELTCKEMFDEWLKMKASDEHNKSMNEDYRKLQLYCKPFMNKKIGSVTKDFVQKWYNKLLTQKKQRGTGTLSAGTVNRVLITLRSAFKIYLPDDAINPCGDRIKKHSSGTGEMYLEGANLSSFLSSVEKERSAYGDDVPDFLLLCILTGQRSGNIRKMEWSEVKEGLWVIPSAKTKQKKVVGVPLSDPVLDILKRRIVTQKSSSVISKYVFPSTKTKEGYIAQPKTPWQRIMTDAGLPHSKGLEGYRIHDLRHSAASMLVSAGCTLVEVQKILGHSDSRTTERYAHLKPNKALMEKIATTMDIAAGEKKVVNISTKSTKARKVKAGKQLNMWG